MLHKSIWALAVCLAAAVFAYQALADDRKPLPSGDSEQVQLKDLLKATVELEQKRKQLGETLLKRAKEGKLTKEECEDTVAALGKLGYTPAIEFTLTRITTFRVSRKGDEFSGRTPRGSHYLYPAIEAMWGFGPPSVEPMVKMYQVRAAELEKAGKKKDDDTMLSNIEYALGHKSLCTTALILLDKIADSDWRNGATDAEIKVLQDLRDTLVNDPRNR